MNNNIDQRISELVDGEVAEGELPSLLISLRSDSELRERWSRYHLISDALHNNLPADVKHGLQARVWSALADEPPMVAPKHRANLLRPWLKQAAGIAVAASVTAIAIFSFQAMNPDPAVVPASTVVAGTPENAAADPTTEAGVALDPYLVNHNEHATSAGIHGMLPYVRLVGHGESE